VWDVHHNDIIKKPTEDAVLEKGEHHPMFHIETWNKHRDDSLLGLNLMEEYK
jgi:hypothetical protein